MKNILVSLLIASWSYGAYCQNVGINTDGSSPDPSAMLDIKSTDKGVLVPRMDSTMRQAIASPATGLLVFDTDTESFWYYRISSWTELKGDSDKGWLVEQTTNTPTSTSDEIYHMGNVAIGKDSADFSLDITGNEKRVVNILSTHNAASGQTAYGTHLSMQSGGAGTSVGSFRSFSGSGTGVLYGVQQFIVHSGSGNHYGSYYSLSGSGAGQQYGAFQTITNSGDGNHWGSSTVLQGNGTGQHIGTENILMGTGSGTQIGTRQTISNTGNGVHYGSTVSISGPGTGAHYGLKNNLSGIGTGPQYGIFQSILNTGSGTHYGTFSTLVGAGTGDQYGARQEVSNSGNGAHYGSYNLLEGTGNGIKYGSRQDITASGTNLQYGSYNSLSGSGNGQLHGSLQKISGTGSGSHFTSFNELVGTGTGNQYGSYQTITNTGPGEHYGSFNSLTGSGEGVQYGSRQSVTGSGSADHFGSYNILSGLGSGVHTGTFQNILSTGGGMHYGSYNTLAGSGSGDHYGALQSVSSTGDGMHYGSYNAISGSGAGVQFGSFQAVSNTSDSKHYGSYNLMSGTGAGTHYGLYNIMTGTGAGFHYASFNKVESTGGGKHVAGYFTASGGSNNFAAIFDEGKVVINECSGDNDFRVESASNTNMLFVDASANNVGIGTATPGAKLSTIGLMRTSFDATETEYVEFKHGGFNGVINTVGDGHLIFQHDGAMKMVISDDGKVGIGNGGPSHPLHMGSGAHVTAGGVWTNASDIAKKKDIKPLKYGLDEVLKMLPKQYTYKADNSASIGFIAQEMEKIIPEVVSGEEGEKGIAYGLLTATLVNAMQEQQAMIDHQNQKISDLENMVQQLADRLEQLAGR